MRKAMVAAMLVLVAACGGRQRSGGTSDPLTVGGATSSKAAVEGFMTAVRAQDLQAMGAIWGNAKGPAREQFSRDELEKRLIIMQCTLQHDQWGFAEGQARLSSGGQQEFLVEVRQKNLRAQTSIYTVQGPASRWYVMDVKMAPLKEFCR